MLCVSFIVLITLADGTLQLLTHLLPLIPPTIFYMVTPTMVLHGCRGDQLVKELEAEGVTLEVRSLKVGDFAWLSRNSSGQELLLPYIIERKRLDDLASSIKDGRFHEQKVHT